MCKYLIFILILFSIQSNSQNRNSVWVFGDSAGINFSNLSSPTPINSVIDTRGSCTSVADSVGNLLFYTFTRTNVPNLNSGQVYNNQLQLMDRGDSIIGHGWYQELTIIPVPDINNIYSLFTLGTYLPNYGLFYSIIDMGQNGGAGKVVSKNIQINTLRGFDGISTIKHGNGRDWWLLFHPGGYTNPPNNTFFSYLITPQGITNPSIDSIGAVSFSDAGYTAFSKDGSRFALCTWNNLLEVFDFNRCTGHLSNPIIVEPENPGVPGEMRSIAFSPDETRLYLIVDCVGGCTGGIGYLIQYDLSAPNIQASRDTIYIFIYPEQPFHVRLAPNDKIYLASSYDNYYLYPDSIRNYINENLGVINQPNNLGTACDFQPYSFYLGGKRTYLALPNNPDYEMGPLIGSGCDSLVGVGSQVFGVRSEELHVFYHPGWQVAFVNAEGLKGNHYSLHVYDLTGREVFREDGKLSSSYFTKDLRCEELAKGMYVVSLRTEREVLTKKFIKE